MEALQQAATAPRRRTRKPAKPRPVQITYSRNFKRKYHSTPTSCDCWVRSKNRFKVCKHMQLCQLERIVELHRRKHLRTDRARERGLALASLDIYYSHLEYHAGRHAELGERVDGLSVKWLSERIVRWERFLNAHGQAFDLSQPVLRRLERWQAQRALGRTSLTA